MVHAVAFWRDLPDNTGRFAFGAQVRQGRGKMTRAEYQRAADAYMRDMPELRTMLSFYSLPDMRSGLSLGEVSAILRANGYLQ